MFSRACGLILLAGVAAILPGQSLPWYLSDHYPVRDATGVPTNTAIILRGESPLADFYSPPQYALKSPSGAVVTLKPVVPSYSNDPNSTYATLTPGAALTPSTRYTFTIAPIARLGEPYSFDFTTGSGPDTTPLQLIGFDPPSGSTGTGISGPFTALFNKRLVTTSGYLGTTVTTGNGYGVQASFALTPDGKGMMVRPQVQYSGWPGNYQITVDPSKFQDTSGNIGQGPPQSAQYITFAVSDTRGPALNGFFPADGETAIPLNAAIRLLFTQVIDSNTVGAGIVLDADGMAVKTRVNQFANGYGIELKPQDLLAANRVYRVSVSSALWGRSGLPAVPLSFQFTTGADPDLTPAQAVDYGPPYGVPQPANVLVAVRANKRIMPLAAVEYSLAASPQVNGGQIVSGSAAISPDGQTFTFVPRMGPSTGSYSVSLLDVVDVTGASFTNGVVSVQPGPVEDHDSPAVMALNPPDGSSGIATGAVVSIAFSEALSGALSGDFARFSRNGERIAAKIAFSGKVVTLTPSSPLAPDTAYLLEVTGAADVAGNVMPPFSARFTTSGGTAAGFVKLLSTSPANSDQGVDVNTSISFTFDAPINPLAAISGFTVSDATFATYPAAATVDGSTITIRPLHPLFHDSAITASVNSGDVSGRYINAQIQFRTGANPDTSAFQVTAVSPPDGGRIDTADRGIALTFSKAVSPASFAAGGIALYSDGRLLDAKVSRTNNDLTLIVTTSLSTGDVTLVVDSRVTDLAGNAVAPFRASYTYSSTYLDSQYQTTVRAMRPPNGSTGVPVNTAISWFLSKPVDLATVRGSLVVTADGRPIAGALELSADAMTLTFRPDAPFAAGAAVRFFQRAPVFRDDYGYNFTIAPAPVTVLRALRYTQVNLGGVNPAAEVEFATEVAVGQGLVTLQTQGFNYTGSVIPTTESHPRARVIRLTPVAPLAPGYYNVVVAPKAGGQYFSLEVRASAPPGALTVTAGPPADAIGVPTNARIPVAISLPLNPLSVNSANLTIHAAGRTIPSVVLLSNAGISLTPTEALPPNTEITATISGLEDLYGNLVPRKAWKFTTGSGPDFSSTVLVESNIPSASCYLSPCAAVELPANSPVVFRFDRAIDPLSMAQNRSISPLVNVTYTASDDLTTWTLTPSPAWAKGQQYSGYLPSLTDLAGNGMSGASSYGFAVAFEADRTAPKLIALSPPDGMAGMPLNAQIMAQFDKQVSGSSGHRVRLLRGDAPVPLVIVQDDLRHLRFAPKKPLAANTTYTVVFEGIADFSSNQIEGTITRTFTTSGFLDSTAFTATVSAGTYAAAASNIPMRVTFSKPVSPATIDASTIPFRKASAIASSYYWIPMPATYAIADDGKSVTVIPRDPLIPGWPYQVLVGAVRDYAGNTATSFYSLGYPAPVFYEGFGADNTPPAATRIPADGTMSVPLNTRLAVVFNETIQPQAAAALLQLTRDGQPVPGKTTMAGTVVTFVPDMPLSAGTTYRLDAGSATDLAGNVSAPVSSTFTTTDSSTFTQFRLVSSNPANGDAGVPADSPLVLTFSKPVDPSTTGAIFFFTSFPVSGRFTSSGNTVTFTPAESWPSAANVTVSFSDRFGNTMQDLTGARLSSVNQINFKTAAVRDPVPPQLVSISPEPGTLITGATVTFRLTFSKTVAVGSGGLVVFSGNQQVSPSTGYATEDPHTLVITVNVPSDSQLTVVGNDSIVDRAGNSLTPFSYQYPTGLVETAERPLVTSVTPNGYATNVTPQTPIVLRFNKAMDPQSLTTAVRVTQDGETITGKLDFPDANHSVQFTPDSPYQAGSRVDVFVLETAMDASGGTPYQRYNSFFTVAGGAKVTSVDQTSFGATAAPETWLELAFDCALDPRTAVAENVWLRAGKQLVAGEVTLRGDRILRFTPSSPMAAGVEHVLTVSAGVRSVDGRPAKAEEFRFRAVAEDAAVVESVERTMRSGRPAMHVRFSAPVDPLSLDDLQLLAADGSEIAATRQVSLDHREVWLVPRGAPADLRFAKVDRRVPR